MSQSIIRFIDNRYQLHTLDTVHTDDFELLYFIRDSAQELARRHGQTFHWSMFNPAEYARENRFVVCFRDHVPIGAHLSRLRTPMLNSNRTVAYQDLLYGKPGTRASLYLLRDFIDYAHLAADDVVTCIGPHTNIKPHTLENLGFTKLETTYRLEIPR